jgi:galactokinase
LVTTSVQPARRPGATHTASAPGRVNLIGEHTDYNNGLVLPTVIPQRATVTLRLRADRVVRATSAQLGGDGGGASEAIEYVQYILGEETRTGRWIDYVQGVTAELAQAGHAAALAGFDVHIDSQVPVGSGLSSSAALELALLRGLREALALPLSDLDLARLGQRAENNLVGAPCGLMDQLAVSLCPPGAALFIDLNDLAMVPIPLPASLELVVIHSGVSHRNVGAQPGADYRTRRAECAAAAQQLGVRSLREVPCTAAALQKVQALPEPLARRARHVVTENERVRQAVAALRAGDLPLLGALLLAGHCSLRDDFEVSIPALDLLVDLAREEPGILGARLTGGGFGGSVVILATAGHGAAAAARIAARYAARSGHTPIVLLPAPAEPR